LTSQGNHDVGGDATDPQPTEEGTLGYVAGELLAPEVPGSGIIGSAIQDHFSSDEVDETTGAGNWLEESGDRTPLAGRYGHSGKMEPVTGQDQDMMERIKFLAGIRENENTDTQENSELTRMKSLSSIFLR
jgi:hypothetical protein